MQLLRIAARNLLRNTRRTVLTALAVALGLAMMVLTITLQAGSYDAMIDSAVATTTGHVVVQDAGYVDDPKPTRVVADAGAIAEALAAALPDATVTPRLSVDGLLMSSGGAVGAMVRGGIPSREVGIDLVPDRIVEGTWLEDDDTRGIILGRKLASALDVELGDRVVYQGQHDGQTTSRLFRLRGVFATGADDLDGFVAFTTLAAAQALLGKGDVANQIAVHLPDPDTAPTAAAIARDALPDLPGNAVVLTWREAQPGLLDLIHIDKVGADVMMAFLGVIVAMGVVNTVLMSVLERTREFGVMMAIGMRPRRVALVVLLEGLVLGVVASALGVALGLALATPLVVNGLDYSSFMGGETMTMGDVVIDSTIHGRYDVPRTLKYAAAAVLVTVLSALYPAWTVTRLKPVEALRHT